jgi:hypothetical protein
VLIYTKATDHVIRESTPSFSIKYNASHFSIPRDIAARMALPLSQHLIFPSSSPEDENNNQQNNAVKIPEPQNYPLRDPTPEPGDLFVICRFEIPMLNYSATSDDIESFSLDQGPPVKWTFGNPDFDQEWVKILCVGSGLEEAQKRAFAFAMQWSGSDKYIWERVNLGGYRMYSGLKKLEHELRGKVHVEGPFGVEAK